jgi:hypothetical protein
MKAQSCAVVMPISGVKSFHLFLVDFFASWREIYEYRRWVEESA